MTGQEIFALGKRSAAANASVPLNMTHLAPRMRFQNRWIAEFWYYALETDNQAVHEPMFYLALELPSENPVEFKRLREDSVFLGTAPEALTAAYYETLNGYLDRCGELVTAGEPDEEAVKELAERWLETAPAVLIPWLRKHADTPQIVSAAKPQEQGEAPPPRDYQDYWKRKLAAAIRAGDDKAAEEAQAMLRKRRN